MSFRISADLGRTLAYKGAETASEALACAMELRDLGGRDIYICDENRKYTVAELEAMKDA